MKKLVLSAGITLLSFGAWAQEPYLSKTFQGGQYRELTVTSSGGKITVTGTTQPTVEVDVYIAGTNSKNPISSAEISRRLENYTLEVRQQGTQILCSAKRNPSTEVNWKESLVFAFDVKTPKQINTHLKTSGGAIQLKGTEGNADIQTSGGSLTIQDVKGRVIAKTSGGSIVLDEVQGTIQGMTSGGAIRVRQAIGVLDVKTSGGSISLDNIRGQVSAKTSGGSITATLQEIDGPVTLQTSGGQISATLPKQTGLDLDIRGTRVQTALKGTFEGTIDPKHVEGALRGGGFPVKINTSAGSVTVKTAE